MTFWKREHLRNIVLTFSVTSLKESAISLLYDLEKKSVKFVKIKLVF